MRVGRGAVDRRLQNTAVGHTVTGVGEQLHVVVGDTATDADHIEMQIADGEGGGGVKPVHFKRIGDIIDALEHTLLPVHTCTAESVFNAAV